MNLWANFFKSLFVFVSSRKHLLSMLLILEFFVLVLFMQIFMFLNSCNLDSYFFMVSLTFSVFEGSLGLSILESMIRTNSKVYFQSFTIS